MALPSWINKIDNYIDNNLDIKNQNFLSVLDDKDNFFNELNIQYMRDLINLKTKNKKQKYNNRFLGGLYCATKDKQGRFNNAISDSNGKPIKLSPYNFNQYEDILEDNNNLNIYATINTFSDYKYERKADKVVAFNGLYIDIDTDHNNSNNNQKGLQDYFLNEGVNDMLSCNFENLHINNKLLKPTYVVNSGHGIHLVYLFKNQIPANNEWIKKIWQGLEYYLIKNIQIALDNLVGNLKITSNMIDSNCRDCSRVFRLPATTNYKQGYKPVECYVTEHNPSARYDFFELYHALLPDFKDNAKKERQRLRHQKNKAHNLLIINSKKDNDKLHQKHSKSLEKLNLSRMSDFNTLQELRHGKNYDGSDYGFREVMLFHYSKYLGANYHGDIFVKKLNEFNNTKFSRPLDKKQVDSIIKQYTKNINMRLNNKKQTIINGVKVDNYGATNDSLIKLFNISEYEQRQLKTIKSKQFKVQQRKAQRRKESATNGAKFKRNELIKKAIDMFEQGKNKSEIARELGKSRPTINKYLSSPK
ncbi:hypothetical protein [Apilactobacillus micheneri]|uniref:hypothetical protein n=1 Tax=Apilactobacillus micheneri TaxID=1899430 RepID=UPI00112E0D5D|nr:hypothetical protein [Apilactobacillus micheneri]TPR49851.1 hypothetical protein DY126_07530 [Apilactobacillus micheneri]